VQLWAQQKEMRVCPHNSHVHSRLEIRHVLRPSFAIWVRVTVHHYFDAASHSWCALYRSVNSTTEEFGHTRTRTRGTTGHFRSSCLDQIYLLPPVVIVASRSRSERRNPPFSLQHRDARGNKDNVTYRHPIKCCPCCLARASNFNFYP